MFSLVSGYRKRDTLKTERILKEFSTTSILAKGRNRGRKKTVTMGAPQEAITEDEIVGMELPDTKANSKNACEYFTNHIGDLILIVDSHRIDVEETY